MELKNIVIIDNNSYSKGGTAQVAVSSAIELARRGLIVTFIAADGQDGNRLKENGVKVINLNQYELEENPNRMNAVINGLWNNDVFHDIRFILNNFDNNDTIVHIHGYLHRFSPSILKACKDSGLNTVLTLHDYFIVCPSGGLYDYNNHKVCMKDPMSCNCVLCNCDKRNYFQKIWRVIRQLLINRYARFNKELKLIFISEFSFSKMKKYIEPYHKTYYVRNPYDLGDAIMFNAENNEDYVYLGRVSSEKGVDVFCEAFSQLKLEKKIKGNAYVVGDGDQRKVLQSKYPEIVFLGWKSHDEIIEIIKKTRALVFPSKWYEGSPLTPIEFMSHGIPCVISNVCSAVEYIINGENGLMFKSEDVNDLKSKLLIADDDVKWNLISQNLRANFNRNEYSLKSHVDNLLKVYNKIISKR